MALKKYKPTTPARRYYSVSSFAEITKTQPEKSLLRPKRVKQEEIIMVELLFATKVLVLSNSIEL